mmetsp:Transcript_69433/g.201510  ORF Transcript_69433/g.201510 Transcript_69433/m.201510 type:complete len:389 (+) Transcript_69433:731-1897(+)
MSAFVAASRRSRSSSRRASSRKRSSAVPLSATSSSKARLCLFNASSIRLLAARSSASARLRWKIASSTSCSRLASAAANASFNCIRSARRDSASASARRCASVRRMISEASSSRCILSCSSISDGPWTEADRPRSSSMCSSKVHRASDSPVRLNASDSSRSVASCPTFARSRASSATGTSMPRARNHSSALGRRSKPRSRLAYTTLSGTSGIRKPSSPLASFVKGTQPFEAAASARHRCGADEAIASCAPPRSATSARSNGPTNSKRTSQALASCALLAFATPVALPALAPIPSVNSLHPAARRTPRSPTCTPTRCSISDGRCARPLGLHMPRMPDRLGRPMLSSWRGGLQRPPAGRGGGTGRPRLPLCERMAAVVSAHGQIPTSSRH